MSRVFHVRFGATLRALACLALFVAGCDQDGPDADAGVDAGAGADAGAECTGDEACDDGVFCNGTERCVAARCIAGTAPCAVALCNESAGTCDVDCDVDGDGHDSLECGGDDCDDEDATRFPGNTEVCDADDVDEDCDPTTFGGRDADGDGYVSSECCNVAADDTRRCGDDCDDMRRGVNPDVPEVCDAFDNDCDGAIDEGVLVVCYADEDGDGYALAEATSIEVCACPVRTTSRPPTDSADCDDTLADVSPGSPEICGNGRDDDCDGTVDEAGNDWYPDCDGDGYGAGAPVRACVSPGTPGGCPGGGHVLISGDCDDTNALVYPAAPEICDGVRNDCASSTVDGPAAVAWCNSPEGPPRAPNTVAACTSGACVFERCVSGFMDCASAPGCETDGRTDTANCGACGNACAPWGGVIACAAGACGEPQEVAAAGGHTCARRGSGAVDCWGANVVGQLGTGEGTVHITPMPVSGLTDAVEVSAGGARTCARRGSGAVVCWGHNELGQLGDGTTTNRFTPTPVSGLTDAVEVSADAGSHTCARRSSGAVVCWGSNGNGQLGDGTTTNRLTPTPVSGLTASVALTAGLFHTCARRSSGAPVCWGSNGDGQLGDGTTTNRSTPTPVSGLTDAVEVSAGGFHTCARRASGAVVCWGRNDNGQLGDGTTTSRSTPTPVSGLTDAVELAAGLSHTCARRSSGAVVCWGYNDLGQLGDGTTTQRLTPTPVSGLTDAVELAAGQSHNCARRASGALVCWGQGTSGQLGDGDSTNRSTPTPVLPPP